MGWKFLFKWNPEYYRSWDELRGWLLDKTIFDEYGEEVSYGEFVHRVESKQFAPSNKWHYGEYSDADYKIVDEYEFFDKEFS